MITPDKDLRIRVAGILQRGDEILLIAKEILVGLNKNFPSKYNLNAITHIDNAVTSLALRRIDREKRNVEGFNKE